MKILERKFLPTKTRAVHAATIAFSNGHFVFSWFGGTREGAGDVRVFLNNLNGDGETIILGAEDNVPRWNPILFPINDRLLLFEKAGIFCDRWQTFIHDITHWTNDITEKEIRETAQVLPAGLNGPVKTKPIETREGILCGSSVETICDWSSYIERYAFINGMLQFEDRSAPLSVKEKRRYTDMSGTRSTLGIIQPSLWRDIDNPNYTNAFFRSSNGLGKIYVSYGKGENKWTPPVPTNLENPNSGIDTLVCHNSLYLVSNPSSEARCPLTIKMLKKTYSGSNSFDTEDELIIRENVEEESPFISKELSYPYIIERDGLFHLVYTYGRSKIEYVVIDPER